jgi:1-acyl-sn-glycerol-3-phosphate acyltransferase
MAPLLMRAGQAGFGAAIMRILRAEVEGLAHVPGSGGVLLAANHRSFLDHFLLASAIPRPVWFLGKVELARGPFGRFNMAMGMIPIVRGTGDRTVVHRLAELLAAGEVVAVFPEGTRSLTGELHRFRSGTARLAAAAGIPTVPIGLLGTTQVWGEGAPFRLLPPRGLVRVRCGDVVPPPADDPAARRAFTERLQRDIGALSGQPFVDRLAPITRSV